MKLKIAIALSVVLLSAGIALACSWPRETVEVAPSVIRSSIVARALVVAKDGTSELRARVAGTARTVRARAGDKVEKGELLAELEADDLVLALERARADLRALEASALAVAEGSRVEERDAVAAEVSAARADLELARDRAARQGRLLGASVSTDERLVEAERGVDAARARLEAAEARRRLAFAGGRAADVEAARARAAAAAAQVSELETRLSWTRIVAPRAAVVLARNVSPGDTVTPEGAPLFELASADVEVKVEVEQRDALGVAAGGKVKLTLQGGGPTVATGRVSRVGGRLERRTIGAEEARVRADALVYPAWVELEGAPPFPLGARLDALVERPPLAVAASLPRDAVLVRDGRARVRTPLGPIYDEVPVELGDADSVNVEVRGIPVGSRVLLAR